MKNNPIWHYRSPTRDEYLKALKNYILYEKSVCQTIFELSKKNKNIHVVVADISPAGKMQEFQKDF